MSALEVLLNSPTDDIVACPAIGPGDVPLLSRNLDVIFNKCLYCTRLKLPLPLEVLLALVGDAGDLEPDKVCAGLLHPSDEGTCLDVFCELTTHLLSRKAAAFRLQFDVECFFKVVQLFCCAAALKDRLGSRLGEVLLTYMKDTDLHADDYRVHRNCCSALISLLRGSQANKSRFGPECAAIAACLENSSDFFFQMQCVEVLYRLYKHRSNYLTDLQTPNGSHGGRDGDGAISSYLLRGIEELPNDSTLLLSIHQLLDNYNRDAHPDRIVAFPVLHMEVDGVEVSRATTMYFSPLLLVVLLPGSTGGYLTIPYEHVRSVKLSKDHKLELRLYVVPAKLALVMSVDERDVGRDKLLVSMTRATMHELRTSVVHQWVAERKRSAPRRVLQPLRPQPLKGTTVGTGATTPPPPPSTSGPSPPPQGDSSRTRSTSHRAIEERSLNQYNERGQEKARGQLISQQRHDPYPSQIQQHQQQQHEQERTWSAITPASHDDKDVSANGEESFLSDVHRAASAKAVRYREEQQAHVQEAVDAVKGEIDELRRWSARERDHLEAGCREDMEVVRRSEAVLKESAAECVQALNAELDDVQALGGLLKAEVDKLRERLAKSLGRSEGVEEAFLVRIKQSVDTRMRDMEETLLTVTAASTSGGTNATTASAGQSLESVTQYIAQQMQAISSGAATPGTLQRENGELKAFKSRRLD